MGNNAITRKKLSSVKKIALGLSGGVDSAVAGVLLKNADYEVTGVYIQCWDKRTDGCTSDEDRKYALRNAEKLGIKFVHLNFVAEYKKRVIDYFYSEYQAGRTPNPDIMCNKEIKFGLFFEWAMQNGFDYVATGHYCRAEKASAADKFKLLMGIDSGKDQSYFLYLLDQYHLSRTLFPVGGYKKAQIRELAKKNALPSMDRPESMGICFIGEVDIRKFLEERLKPKKGDVLNTQGQKIGEHDGVWFYTIGQRHGFTVKEYTGQPMYVISKNADKNELVVGFRDEAKASSLVLQEVHLISGGVNLVEEIAGRPVLVRIRHLGELIPAKLSVTASKNIKVVFDKEVFGIAPGQSAVIYCGDEVVGGGIIAV